MLFVYLIMISLPFAIFLTDVSLISTIYFSFRVLDPEEFVQDKNGNSSKHKQPQKSAKAKKHKSKQTGDNVEVNGARSDGEVAKKRRRKNKKTLSRTRYT